MRHLLHGLVVEVDVALDLPPTDREPVDLALTGEPPRNVSHEPPDGVLVAARKAGDRVVAFVVRRGTACTLRLPGVFEATIELSTGVRRCRSCGEPQPTSLAHEPISVFPARDADGRCLRPEDTTHCACRDDRI